MKGVDILCSSQAATSISTAMDSDQPSSSSSAARLAGGSAGGGRAIDRHNPIIQDQKRLSRPLIPPNFSTQKNKISNKKTPKLYNDQKRKSIAFADENDNNGDVKTGAGAGAGGGRKQGGVLGWGCTRPGDFISPATSSRYLLGDKALPEFDPLLKLAPAPAPAPEKPLKSYNEQALKKKYDEPPSSSSSLSSSHSSDQVVVLRVSLHCRGCERKMRKHISKMEGVTSFNIDFAAKKLTVVGDVTPLAVLTSVSKVKNAKLLTPTTISSSSAPPPVDSNFFEIKKQLRIIV